jgi:hypothetical protein
MGLTREGKAVRDRLLQAELRILASLLPVDWSKVSPPKLGPYDEAIRRQDSQYWAWQFDKSITVTCIVCGAAMQAKRKTKRTCSAKCRQRVFRAWRSWIEAAVSGRQVADEPE